VSLPLDDDSHALVLRTARRFVDEELRPAAAELDAHAAFPRSQLARLGALGLIGLGVPAEHGGGGLSTRLHADVLREIASGCASTAVIVAVTSMVAEVIARFGSDAQRARYVPGLCSGAFPAGAFALSEPGAGSDPGALETRAEATPDGYRISGKKQWITSGDEAAVLVVWARTGEPGTRGLSAFLVEPSDPGVTVLRREEKLGLCASSTVALAFDDVPVPHDRLLGQLGDGFRIAMTALDGGRIGIAAQAIGIAEAALAEACAYAKVQWMLADSDVELRAARALLREAADDKDRGGRYGHAAAVAKLFASEAAGRIADRNVQIHGAAGYVRSYAAERHLRDVRVTRIYEGTSEIQRLVIARGLLAEG